jgi:hypothetical protein
MLLSGAYHSQAAVKVAGQMLIDLHYTRGITTAVVGAETQATSWTNYGVAGGSFVQPAASVYSATLLNSPPFIGLNKGGAGINVPEANGGRALVATFATPAELQGNSPYSIEVWLWKNNTQSDQRGVFAWTENQPLAGDAGKLCAGDPAVLHNNAKDLNWVTQPSEGAWHHVAVTFDGATEKLYLDGSLQASAAKTLNMSAGTYYSMLFSGIVAVPPNNTSFSLNGAIAAVRVHTDALSASDVSNNNAAGISAVPVIDVSVKALAPTLVTTTTATLNGNLSATTSSETTALTFYYGTTDPGNTTSGWAGSATLAAPNSVGPFSAPITGLGADTTYYVRIRGTNASGEAWSAPLAFHTPGPPSIANLPASPGASGNATVSATLNPNGYPSTVKLFWGTSDGGAVPANWANEVDLGAQAAGTVSHGLSGLTSGVPYYYTFSASSAAGSTIAAPSRSFKLRNIPGTSDLLFSAVTEVLPESGVTGTWPTFLPAGQSLVPINGPTVKQFGGVKWFKNLSATSQGFRLQDPSIPGGNYVTPIEVNGASVVVAVKPLPRIGSDNWDSIVDIFYNRLVLGMRNDTGQVCTWRNGDLAFSTATLPVGEVSVLSMVVQPDGSYKVWANGVEIMNIARNAGSAYPNMDFLVPNVPGTFANAINLGRNNPDGWPVFNGHIGDVFVYKTALGDTQRQALEADLTGKFVTDATLQYTITATAGANGSVSPAGPVSVLQGADHTVTIAGDSGYVVGDVLVDGASVGPVLTYTFSDVSAPHTIAASFISLPPQTITASAGPNGSISPVGATVVSAGDNQTFVISPNSGYKIANVLVDGVSVGTPSSYTFNFVVAPHTIEASFEALSLNIPRSGDLLFSVITDSLPGDGAATGNWPLYVPNGQLTALASPTVELVEGIKWEKNVYQDGDGFRFGTQQTAPIPANGATVVAVVRPVRNTTPTDWTSVVDVFYNRLMLGVKNSTGQVVVWRNGTLVDSGAYSIPDGQKTVLSLVVQPTGEFEAFANGQSVIVNNTLSDMSTLDPTWNNGATGFWSYINVGRNEPDGWTTFNGNIGDVFVYKTALTAPELGQLEGIMYQRYGIVLHTITASAEANGSISPSGATPVLEGQDSTFTFIPDFGYAVDVVTVDGVPQPGSPTSYTFTNVVGPHTISVTFTQSDPYNDWIGFFFPTQGDPDAAKDADPDGDGIINLAEYAFDDDPSSGAASGRMRSSIEDDGGEQALMLTLPVIDGAFFDGATSLSATIDGVHYTIEGSNDLATFDQVVTEVIPARDAGMDFPNFGWSYRTFRLGGAVGGGTPRGPKGFLRARVEEAP